MLKTPTLPEPKYSMVEIADMLGYHKTYVYSLVRQGKLRATESVDGTLKVSRDDLVRYLATKGK